MAHSPARALDVGSVIAGTYTIEGLLGKGGMGEVFVASHARLPGKKVAIKVLHPDVAGAEALTRFRREAEIASRLGHPNIVEVHDWNQLPDGTPYIVLELLRGESLADRVRRGPLSLDEVFLIVRQVGSALAAAHREQIVHRDLKPQNIFLVPSDDGLSIKAKVLDFGISKIRGSTTVQTQDTAMLGTPQYMSPEQATGRHDAVDGRTDVFALGAVVYEMLSGQPVFGGMTIPEVVFKVVYEEAPSLADKVPTLPPHVVTAVARALAKQPGDRWSDVESFVEALTGSPLQTGRRQVQPVQPGVARPPAAQDALAATIDSGDHAVALAAGTRAPLAAAQTLASDTGVAKAVAPAATTPPPPARKSRIGLLVGVTAVIAAGAAVAVVLAIGGDRRGPAAILPIDAAAIAAAPPIDAAAIAAAPPIDAAAIAAAPPIDAAAIAAAPPIDAGHVAKAPIDAGHVAKAPVDAHPRATPDTAPPDEPPAAAEDGDDTSIRTSLAAGNAALAGGDADEAMSIAKKLTNDHPRAQNGWALRARAACALGDREAAAAALRRVSRPMIERAVRRACKSSGLDL